MKALRIIINIAFVLATLSVVGQDQLQAYFSYSTFYAPSKGPYIETYLSVNGNSAVYAKNEKGKLQSKIEITYVFKQGEEIKQFDKYELLGPEITDSTNQKVNFLDQQRIALPNGDYDMTIKIKDLNSANDAFSSEQPISISFPEQKMSISTIELVEKFEPTKTPNSFTKSGVDVIPNVSDYYPESKSELQFYCEVYNAKSQLADQKYLIKYYIASSQNLAPNPNYVGYIRQNPTDVGLVLRKFNIEKLRTGNYYLIVEARNQSNEMICAQSIFFQRTNPKMDVTEVSLDEIEIANTFVEPYVDLDTLKYFVRSLRPLSDQGEQKFIDKYASKNAGTNVEVLQRFLLSFWKARNSVDPGSDWNRYAFEVKKVNSKYSTSIKNGFETDRGRVYLKYGPPNVISERPNEPNSYPYEIWQYNRIGNQSNGRFVFYDSDLITNDYELLHSTVFGELQNYRWEMTLQKRNTLQNDLDQESPGGSYGTRSRDFFEIPR